MLLFASNHYCQVTVEIYRIHIRKQHNIGDKSKVKWNQVDSLFTAEKRPGPGGATAGANAPLYHHGPNKTLTLLLHSIDCD